MASDLGDRVMHGLRWTTFVRLFSQVLTWSVTIIVMRFLAPADYGLVALTGIFVVYASVVSELGLGAALIQSRLTAKEVLRSAFGVMLAVSLTCCGVLALSAGWIAAFFDEPALRPLVQFAALQFPISVLGTIPYALLAQRLQYREISLASLISSVAQSVTTLMLAWLYPSPWALAIGTFVAAVVRVIVLNVYCPLAMWPSFSIEPLRPIWRVAVFIFGERSLWYWYGQFDSFIIGKRLGAYELGAFSTAKLLATLPLDKVMDVINQVSFPAFSAINDDLERVRASYRKALRVTAVYAFAVFWGLAVIAPDVISLLLGERWQVAALPAAIVALSVPFRMLQTIGSPVLDALGRSDISVKAQLQTFVIVGIALFAGSSYGLVGVSIAFSVAAPLASLWATHLTLRTMGLAWKDYLAQVGGAAVSGAVMALLIELGTDPLLTHFATPTRLAMQIATGAAAYWFALSAFDRAGRDEVLRVAGRLLGRNA
jgi:teichuronic acid exporter